MRVRATTLWAMALAAAVGCATTPPKDVLRLSPDSLEKRQLQTRRFEGIDEKNILAASAGVLQDLGFNIDESATTLGLIVASKERTAVEGGKVVTALLLSALTGTAQHWDKDQKIRVCLVSWTASEKTDVQFVRVTFQRIIWNDAGQVSKVEAIEDPGIYQQFFEKLSKSVFLEGHKL